MDLQTISQRTQLSLRKLRYVLDHKLLPGMRVKVGEHEVGRRRSFTDFEGFGVAAAALLLDGGMKRDAVIAFFETLVDLKEQFGTNQKTNQPERPLLLTAFSSPKAALACFGDGTNVRVQVGDWDTGWRQPRTFAKLSADYQPQVIVQLNLGRLRDQLRD